MTYRRAKHESEFLFLNSFVKWKLGFGQMELGFLEWKLANRSVE